MIQERVFQAKRSRCMAILDASCFALVILSSIIKWNGVTFDTITRNTPTFITPAPFTSFMWIIVFTAMMCLAIWEVFGTNYKKDASKPIGYWFIITSLFQAVYFPLWSYRKFLPAFIIITLGLLSLLKLNWNMRVVGNRWIISPFCLWAGWMLCQFTLSFTAMMDYTFDSGFFATNSWAIMALIFLGMIACIWSVITLDICFATAIAWFIIGVYAENPMAAVRSSAFIMFLFVIGFIIAAFATLVIQNKRRKPEAEQLLPATINDDGTTYQAQSNVEVVVNPSEQNALQHTPQLPSVVNYAATSTSEPYFYQTTPVFVPHEYQPAPYVSSSSLQSHNGTPHPFPSPQDQL